MTGCQPQTPVAFIHHNLSGKAELFFAAIVKEKPTRVLMFSENARKKYPQETRRIESARAHFYVTDNLNAISI